MKRMSSGFAKAPISLPTCSRSSFLSVSSAFVPAASVTKAASASAERLSAFVAWARAYEAIFWASRMAWATSCIVLRLFMASCWILRKASASLRPWLSIR